MATSLNKTFPHVDKVCDAPFLKKATGIPTKKDTVRFILETEDCRKFFAKLDSEMIETDQAVQEKITKYFTTIPEAIDSFKTRLKVVREQAKLGKKQAERDALKDEILREMEAEKIQKATTAQIRSELDLPAEPTPDTSASIPTPKPAFTIATSGFSPNFISNEHSVPAPELQLPTESTTTPSTGPATIPNSSPAKEMDLDQFFQYFKATLDMGLIKINSPQGQVLQIKTIEFDHQQIKLVIEPSVTTPSIILR